jgi:cation transport ATPase
VSLAAAAPQVTPGLRPTAGYPEKQEKREKDEKSEKHEKQEKHEKREMSLVAQLSIGVLILFVGVSLFLASVGAYRMHEVWPLFLFAAGIIIIVIAIFAGRTAMARSPKP